MSPHHQLRIDDELDSERGRALSAGGQNCDVQIGSGFLAASTLTWANASATSVGDCAQKASM